jgi:hypothetical protein
MLSFCNMNARAREMRETEPGGTPPPSVDGSFDKFRQLRSPMMRQSEVSFLKKTLFCREKAVI